MKADVARILLEVKAITVNTKDPFVFVSGAKSPIYCDNRIVTSYPTHREQIVNYFLQKIEENNLVCDVIAGTAMGGIPWAAFIATKLNKPMIYIRAKEKAHGKENKVEGVLEKGQKVIIIEDLISTGKSAINAVDTIKENGGDVQGCMAIFTYEMEEARQKFKEANCPLLLLSDLTTFISVARENKYITEEESEKLLQWKNEHNRHIQHQE